jgi:hypothetical protein
MHKAISSIVRRRPNDYFGTYINYPKLSTEDLTLAMYKLIGESAIALMGEGGLNPSISKTLYKLAPPDIFGLVRCPGNCF